MKKFATLVLIVLAVSMTACLDKDGANSLQPQAGTNTPAKDTFPPTKDTAGQRQFQVTATPSPAVPTAMPTAQPEVQPATYVVTGFPTFVDINTVDIARGDFVNVLGMGTQAWLAEDGKLLVGPDFEADLFRAANGTNEYFNSINQQVFETEGPSYFNCQEGGYMVVSSSQLKVEFLDKIIELIGAPRHNWFLIIRCRNSDNTIDTDLNSTPKFTKYPPAHIVAMGYPGNPGGGFISEGQFNQLAQTSQSEGSNCGANGCSRLSAFFADVNTGAITVITKDSPTSPWRLVYSNFVTQ